MTLPLPGFPILGLPTIPQDHGGGNDRNDRNDRNEKNDKDHRGGHH